MIGISVWHQGLSDTYLRQVSQLGVNCIDFGSDEIFLGDDMTQMGTTKRIKQIKQSLARWGLRINRVTLPTIAPAFMAGETDDMSSIERACDMLRWYGEAGITIARQRFGGDIMPGHTQQFKAVNRAGYGSRGEYAHNSGYVPPARERIDLWWQRFERVYERLVPIAEEYQMKLALHPSDSPFPGTPFDSLGLHRALDMFPSQVVGLLYCIGTRAEAGGSALVLDELNYYGRKGRIFAVHMRNVRGSLATAGGFTEVLLDDGDLNMAKIIKELHRIGFDGCLNPDHVPVLHEDASPTSLGTAYSIGYIKALLASLYA